MVMLPCMGVSHMHLKTLGKSYIIFCFLSWADGTLRILSASIRDNILFSHEYDETFYNLVIEGGCLPVFCRMGNYNS
jgi:hypothetical protein